VKVRAKSGPPVFRLPVLDGRRILRQECQPVGAAGAALPSQPAEELQMTTPLEKTLRREVLISGEPFIVSISPEGLKLTHKGRRKGLELHWDTLVNGDAALAVALNASLGQLTAAPVARKTAARPARRPKARPPSRRAS
jgi:hypothetical protein